MALPITIGGGDFHSYWEAPLGASGTFDAARAAHPAFVSLTDPLWVGTGMALVADADGNVTGVFIPDGTSNEELKRLSLDRATVEELRDGALNELTLDWMFLSDL